MFKKKNELNKRLMQVSNADDVVRSHAYSRVAGKSSSVPTRRLASSPRHTVSGYRDSMVGSIGQYREVRASLASPSHSTEAGSSITPVQGNRPASGRDVQGTIGARDLSQSPSQTQH